MSDQVYFLNMIENLRQNEDVMLYNNVLKISKIEAQNTTEFLKKEYQKESLNFPFTPPNFDLNAVLWAAKSVYIAAQLILYRENKTEDIPALLPKFEGEITPASILSADLCLRFLPDMLTQLKFFDSQDLLVKVLEEKLQIWHYSGVNYTLEIDKLDFTNIDSNECLRQLYINRIIENKKIHLAKLPPFKDNILANLGIYGKKFWKEFSLENEHVLNQTF
jgi:MoxR-vWA-beta-propeller ternary system domain bpX4